MITSLSSEGIFSRCKISIYSFEKNAYREINPKGRWFKFQTIYWVFLLERPFFIKNRNYVFLVDDEILLSTDEVKEILDINSNESSESRDFVYGWKYEEIVKRIPSSLGWHF
jgi:hypothetical protein